jgi:hypothetical protein
MNTQQMMQTMASPQAFNALSTEVIAKVKAAEAKSAQASKQVVDNHAKAGATNPAATMQHAAAPQGRIQHIAHQGKLQGGAMVDTTHAQTHVARAQAEQAAQQAQPTNTTR